MPNTSNDEQLQAKQGVILGLLAYFMWGFAPVYFKFVASVSPFVVLAHRVLWSFLLLIVLIYITKNIGVLKATLRSKKKLIYLAFTSVIIGVNWLVYIWAISVDLMIDASLGYFINPLVNVLLGMVFLGERLRKLQLVAVALAFIGVAIQLVIFGSIPIVAITLACTFGAYGLLRKKVSVDAYTGLFIETLIMLPFALLYLWWVGSTALEVNNETNFGGIALLMLSGIVTTLPLLCFAGAAIRLKLSTIGFLQYIGPTIMLLLAVFAYGENFTSDKISTFICIWTALAIFMYDAIASKRRSSN